MIKLRTAKGKMSIICAYAPPQTPNHSYQERQLFFEDLGNFWHEISCNGPKYIIGDMNSRLYKHIAGEEHIIGPSIVNHDRISIPVHSNRSLLVELYTDCELQVSNSFCNKHVQDIVTYKEVWYDSGSEISSKNHEMLDLLLSPRQHAHFVKDMRVIKDYALQSHHYLFVVNYEVSLARQAGKSFFEIRGFCCEVRIC